MEGALDGRGWLICGERFMICKDSNYKFYIMALIWFTIYVETENCCITCYFPLIFLAFFVLLKGLLIVLIFFYFVNSLFKRKSV